jgi:O-Antigen ligase
LTPPRYAPRPVTTNAWMIAPQTRPPSWQPAFYLSLGYIFITYVRFPEVVLMFTGHGFRLGLLSVLTAILVVVLSGGFMRIFSSKIVLALLAFTALLYLGIPFSIWRGGSFNQCTFWLVSLVGLILLAGCLDGLEQCRKAMATVAVSVLAIEVLSFVFGSTSKRDVGRFSFASGTFANANDLAALLLIGLPFCLLVMRTRSGLSVMKIGAACGLFLIPITVVRTGSRGALLALLIMFMIYFFSVPPIRKLPLAIAAMIVVVASLVVASRGALDRYKSVFVDSNQIQDSGSSAELSAMESMHSRKQLFLSSLRLTFFHPLLGVGPGMFQVADAKAAGEKGIPAAWHETHNTYTQISSEDGLPALGLYLAALYLCFKRARFARRIAKQYPELPFLWNMAFSLELSLVAFTITAIFASNAYYFYFPLIAGICAAFDRAVTAEVTALAARPRTPQPQPPAVPRRPAPYSVPARAMH